MGGSKPLTRAPPLNLSVFGRAGFLSQDKIFVYLIAGMQMSNFRTKLPNWTAVSLGNGNCNRGQGEGGGNKSSSILLTLDSEFTQERPNSFSSVWKPVWYTGWHTGVLYGGSYGHRVQKKGLSEIAATGESIKAG